MKFKDKLMRFMYGRYGNDKLNTALTVLFFVVWFINLFARTYTLYGVTLAILVWQIFRMMSRNTAARQRENGVYLKIRGKIISGARMFCTRIKDIRTFRYRRCPDCRATLRLPRRRGKHTVRCPKCGKEFPVNIII